MVHTAHSGFNESYARPREILVRRIGPHARSILLAALVTVAFAACSHESVADLSDAATARSADAGVRTARGRRRRAHGRNGTVALAHAAIPSGPMPTGAAQTFVEPNGDPGGATSDDLALGDDPGGSDPDEAVAPAPRPRMTETGPMLPEDLGPRPEANLDMAHGEGSGPMGLEPQQISDGLEPLMSRLRNCAAATSNGNGPRGRVSVRLRVRGDGHPTAARVSGGSGPPEFVTCVRRVIASARFDHFQGPDTFATWGFDVE